MNYTSFYFKVKKSEPKHKSYMRYCRFNIAVDCQPIFYTIHSRTNICDSCRYLIHKLGTNVVRWKQMVEKKLTEKIEWKSETEGLFHVHKQEPVVGKNGRIIGYMEMSSHVEASRDDLEANLQLREEMRDGQLAKIEKLNRQIEALGKKPAVTSEMAKLQENLNKLGSISKFREFEDKLENEQKVFDEQEIAINERKRLLNGKQTK